MQESHNSSPVVAVGTLIPNLHIFRPGPPKTELRCGGKATKAPDDRQSEALKFGVGCCSNTTIAFLHSVLFDIQGAAGAIMAMPYP
jgi:hypothetical protein